MREATIASDYIELAALLKFENLVASGGEAKLVIGDGLVRVNGVVERRRGKKIRPGDTVSFEGEELLIVEETIEE